MGTLRHQRIKARLDGLLFHLLLAVAIGLAGWLNYRYHWSWDWSDSARNSLTPASQQLLSKLELPLRITAFAPDNRELRQRTREVVSRYQRYRPDIQLLFVDPVQHPSLTRELGIRVAGELRLEYGGRSENLQQIDEQGLSNAIQRLLPQGETWIVSLQGHGERRFTGQANHDLEAFGTELGRKGFRLQSLDLASTPQLPDNTGLLVIAGPMLVFYTVEDWVLFSISILLLIGIAWTLGKAMPHYWQQVQLFLNIGSVREGERLIFNDLPWKVKQINFFSTLENPVAKLTQRIPLGELVDMKSRPLHKGEPWFPCKKDDWVIMQDGMRGKVIGISQELVTLVQRGGAHRTYTMSNFLGGSPLNLAPNFRIKEVFGITYNLQAQSTAEIPAMLEAHVAKRIEEEGYGDKLVNLRVEFAAANTSSLDMVVIADFKGELGDLYNRLRRAIQRWCVEASTEHGWEIPFQQITLHHAAES